jgi:hypothetical integral membrane protein (TIGR02206 family)
MVERFRPFGAAHLVTLAVVAALALVGGYAARRRASFARQASVLVALLLPVALVSLMVVDACDGVSWRSFAPLQLCDLAVPLAAVALVARRPLAIELTLTWVVAGTVPALLTPDLAESAPHPRFLLYFAQHGGLVVATALLVGSGARPRPGTPLRALAWLNVVALVVGVIDLLTGANFMYLRHKPGAATPLDHLGPWPLYILACEPVALAVFATISRLLPARHEDEAGQGDSRASA